MLRLNVWFIVLYYTFFFTQIQLKMSLRCFLKIYIFISTKIQGDSNIHFILFVSRKLIMILFVYLKNHACQIF